jgi:2'-5' RNA ligase
MDRAKSLRLFFAIWPDAKAAARLAALAHDVAHSAGGRAVAPDNLHVTVAFVGSVAAERVESLRAAAGEATVGARAFDLSLEHMGGAHGGELVWIAPASLPAEFVSLHAALDRALAQRGFATEQRAFRPHVTLARRCARRSQQPDVEPIAWRLDELTLMSSITRAEGSDYRRLASWSLR